MTKVTRWWSYVEDVAGDMQQKDIAHRVGISASHVSRWARGETPNAVFALAFARGFGVNVLRALVEAEIITGDEAQLHEVRVGLEDFTLAQLLDEALQRVRSGG